jgi:hypothetical protein
METWALCIPGKSVRTKNFTDVDRMIRYAYRHSSCVSHGSLCSPEVGDTMTFHSPHRVEAYAYLIYKE